MLDYTVDYMVGIDEVGRGPIAGPVAVGAFIVNVRLLKKLKSQILGKGKKFKDSKKLSSNKRAEIKNLIDLAAKDGLCEYSVSMIPANKIDKNGLAPAIKMALNSSLKNVLKKRSGIMIIK